MQLQLHSKNLCNFLSSVVIDGVILPLFKNLFPRKTSKSRESVGVVAKMITLDYFGGLKNIGQKNADFRAHIEALNHSRALRSMQSKVLVQLSEHKQDDQIRICKNNLKLSKIAKKSKILQNSQKLLKTP